MSRESLRFYDVRVQWSAYAHLRVKARNTEEAENTAQDIGLPWPIANEVDEGDGYEISSEPCGPAEARKLDSPRKVVRLMQHMDAAEELHKACVCAQAALLPGADRETKAAAVVKLRAALKEAKER